MTDGSVGVESEQNPRGHRLTQEWHKGLQMITCLNCDDMHVSRKDFEEYDCEDPGAFARHREQQRKEIMADGGVDAREKARHEQMTDHTIVPRYV